MSATHDDTSPYWAATATFPQCPPLREDTTADVVVIGGGITGLTTAYLLTMAGRRVVVLERNRCALADTGHTTAHLTMVTDTRLSELADRRHDRLPLRGGDGETGARHGRSWL